MIITHVSLYRLELLVWSNVNKLHIGQYEPFSLGWVMNTMSQQASTTALSLLHLTAVITPALIKDCLEGILSVGSHATFSPFSLQCISSVSTYYEVVPYYRGMIWLFLIIASSQYVYASHLHPIGLFVFFLTLMTLTHILLCICFALCLINLPQRAGMGTDDLSCEIRRFSCDANSVQLRHIIRKFGSHEAPCLVLLNHSP